MNHRRLDTRTGDLLAWQPPKPEVGFVKEDVRGASLSARFAKAISLSLKDCGKSRAAIAGAMSEYLGENISPHMLDAYASEAREAHVINVVRLAALVHATGDYRLLALLPELFGLIVVEKKYRHWINAAVAKDKAEELHRLADAELRAAKSGGIG